MKQRLAAALVMIAALLVAALGLAAPASAGDATTSATSAEKKAKNAKKQKQKKCKKYKKVKKNKSASKQKKKKAKKACNKAKKKLKKANKKVKKQNARYFDVCKNGCKYKTIQKGVDAAGKWQKNNKVNKNGNASAQNKNAIVRIQPATYVEGALLHGKQKGRDYDHMTIMGVKQNLKPLSNAKKVILEGKNAKTVIKNTPGWLPGDPNTIPANNAIEGRSIDGLVLKNMWARNYSNNTFFVWASNIKADNERCADFVMDNLVSSDTRSYGLFSRNCFGGKFINSEGWNHGDSALYIGETPCDSYDWTNHGQDPAPCQADPNWTIVKNFKSHQNVLGYSGTNSKYVKITDSAFYNNGAGVVPNTLDSEKFEPTGWLVLENNDIFWNNYNYYSTGSEFETVSNGLGELVPGVNVNYPIGAGIFLLGSDGVVSKNNNIFGNEKWGSASVSFPIGNEGDDAKNLNNQFVDNVLGRGGMDPNGTDFLSDNTGGGNCFQGNGPAPTYEPGNGMVPLSTIYPPTCPQPVAINDDTVSLDLTSEIQIDAGFNGDPDTVVGYVAADPPELMECGMSVNTPHPAYTDDDGYVYTEKRADPVVCP